MKTVRPQFKEMLLKAGKRQREIFSELQRMRKAGERCIGYSAEDILLVELQGYAVDLHTGQLERIEDEPIMIRVPVVGELTAKTQLCVSS